jgi:hypothetical protein
MKTPKIAIFVEGGIIQGIRSNIGSDLDIEIVDADLIDDDDDDDENTSEERWEELESELEFGNY